MFTINLWHCMTCGGTNVWIDARVSMNDEDDVRTFDASYCDDCDGEERRVELREVEEATEAAAPQPDAGLPSYTELRAALASLAEQTAMTDLPESNYARRMAAELLARGGA